MSCELWRPIDGHEGYYVSSKGRVWSEYSKRLLHPTKNSRDGYMSVMFRTHKRCRLGRLVAQAFIPNPRNLPEVNHIDCDRSNDNVENLEWCNRKYNMNYGDRAYKYGISRGVPVAQINKDTDEIINIFHSAREAARKLGLRSGNISRACNHGGTIGGYKWKKIA